MCTCYPLLCVFNWVFVALVSAVFFFFYYLCLCIQYVGVYGTCFYLWNPEVSGILELHINMITQKCLLVWLQLSSVFPAVWVICLCPEETGTLMVIYESHFMCQSSVSLTSASVSPDLISFSLFIFLNFAPPIHLLHLSSFYISTCFLDVPSPSF